MNKLQIKRDKNWFANSTLMMYGKEVVASCFDDDYVEKVEEVFGKGSYHRQMALEIYAKESDE
jgi:hypothetical protein